MSAPPTAALRARAALVIARRQLRETAYAPGIYVVLALSLGAAHWLVTAFAASVDAGGLDPARTALTRLLADAATAAFGRTFFDGLFAEGPFAAAWAVSYGVVALYLAASSVSRLALERRVRATELVSYGPADATSSYLGALASDLAVSLASGLVLLGMLGLLAARFNLAMGPRLAVTAATTAGLGLALSSMGVFCAAATTRSGSAVALFAGLLLFFAGLLVARYAAFSGYVRDLATVVSTVLRWLSPLAWWDLVLSSQGRPLLGALGLLALPALSATYLAAAHLLSRAAGERP